MGGTSDVNTPANTETNEIRDSITSNDINSLEVSGSTSVGLATFDAEAVTTTVANSDHQLATSLPYVEDYQDIKKYFERPRHVANLTVSTTRGNLYNIDIANPLGFWPAAAVGRLNGAYGMKADLKFMMTVAATPFQQGVVAMGFQYGVGSFEGVAPIYRRGQLAQQITNLSHTRLDLAEQTLAELVVPYYTPFEFVDIGNTTLGGGDTLFADWGALSITQILPYRAVAGTSDPTIKLYVSLHNMQLFGAVPVVLSAALPQSGITEHQNKQATTTRMAAGNLLRSVMPSLRNVPKLSEVTKSISWLSDKVGQTAESFGFSKPVDEAPNIRMHHSSYAHEHHVDQQSEVYTVSPYQSNRLAMDAGVAPVDVDEMALTYVLGQYNQVFVGNIATSDTVGTTIYASNVCPTSMWFKTNSGRPGGNTAFPATSTLFTNSIVPSNVCYISQMFRNYRGSLKFRFTFSKTKFHAGRVLLAFIPSTFDSDLEPVLSNPVPLPEVSSGLVQPFQYSSIYDLKDTNTIDFEAPYVCGRPWLSVFGSIGGISMTIIDPLIANGQVSDLIDFMVEVAAGDDFELANYVGSGLIPTALESGTAFLQSGLSSVKQTVGEVTQYTAGEKFSSLKELLQTPYNISRAFGTGNSRITLPNWYNKPTNNTALSTPLAVNFSIPGASSATNVISSMYSFGTGGTIITVQSSIASKLWMTITQTTLPLDTGTPANASIRNRGNNNKARILCSGIDSAIRVKMPSYQKTLFYPFNGCQNTKWDFSSPALPSRNPYTNTAYALSVQNSDTIFNEVIIGVAAADDARCMGFVGAPVCYIPGSVASGNIDTNNFTPFR